MTDQLTDRAVPPAGTPARAPTAGGLRPDDLAELLGLPFTGEQLAAITAPLEPLLVVAGAGSV